MMNHNVQSNGFVFVTLIVLICVMSACVAVVVRLNHHSAKQLNQELNLTRAKLAVESALEITSYFQEKQAIQCEQLPNLVNSKLDIFPGFKVSISASIVNQANELSAHYCKISAVAMQGEPYQQDYIHYQQSKVLSN